MEDLWSRYKSLTPRQRQVMEKVVSGLLNKQVAAELGISEITVKVKRGQVMHKDAGRLFSGPGKNARQATDLAYEEK